MKTFISTGDNLFLNNQLINNNSIKPNNWLVWLTSGCFSLKSVEQLLIVYNYNYPYSHVTIHVQSFCTPLWQFTNSQGACDIQTCCLHNHVAQTPK